MSEKQKTKQPKTRFLTRDYPANFASLPSPCYVLEEAKFKQNLQLLQSVQQKSGAKILLALKGYALWRSFPLAKEYLSGITASGIYEARLGYEEFGKEITTFSPSYKSEEMQELVQISDHIIFNSFTQWQTFKGIIESQNELRVREGRAKIEVGLRVNPQYSEVSPEIYNPCVEGSRLGIPPKEFKKGVKKFGLEGVSGLHFHTHCEQNSDALKRTLTHFIAHFKDYIPQMRWINFGGGHHITRKDYDVDLLIKLICDFKARFQTEVYLEPGEAVGWQCGFLIGSVVDIVRNGIEIAILDVSAAAHMPDCLEMPYRPMIRNSFKAKAHKKHNKLKLKGDKPYAYRLGGPTCLAGDVIGDYSFKEPLKIGDRLIFEDMVHYTIVKNNTFNGIPLPCIGMLRENGEFELFKEFSYQDYKHRNS
ncbi:carboxynorspermidine decarboxylase [Helicobacter sp. MIT 05-5294]|uniref:carboxynorspermidine decarboxylase n=1 Tax=Helicobacter sp. MIT 05-5294 TaxID=1548150 RepID=UPI0010FEA8D0|nr:carboxynorspermidine decarboxylase [Helicobacter sp. MIT 05-5294]TLD87017.1 carboxynorspermidine decarboxylase [Helicobacter sp. MIT 05-5294]